MKILSVLRWTAGGVVFAVAAVIFGQIGSESRMTPVPSRLARISPARLTTTEAPKYSPIAVADPEVQTALRFALADQRRKNRSAVTLLSVLAAERQSAAGANLRLCLSLDRHGRTDAARVIVHRSEKDQWSVTLWAWGACRK
jgi:hypothetical protein